MMSSRSVKLILPDKIALQVVPQIKESLPVVEVVQVSDTGVPEADISDAEALMWGWFTEEQLCRLVLAAPNLRWLHTPMTSVTELLIPEVCQRPILVTNSAGVLARSVAEFAMMSILCHAKRASELLTAQRETRWHADLTLDDLDGKTILILGLGHIGRAIAQRANAFNMRVLGCRRHPQPTEGVTQVLGPEKWRSVVSESDYIVIAVPLTPVTRGMFDRAALNTMKREAYLVNIARGGLVDELALLETLQDGRIAGAALDTFVREPLPGEHPFWSCPNLFVTPHISWSSPTAREHMLSLFLENLRRYTAGEEMLNCVDKYAGY